jgi:phage terminase large subunit GpA-like protein
MLLENEYQAYAAQLKDIILSGNVSISNIKPSDWVEQNVIMGKPFPGPYRYSRTPYCMEIINCFAQDHPMLWIAVMKGAQIGLSAGVLIPIMLWMIKNDPCNTYFLVGSPDLIEKATEKLDLGIDNAGLRQYIKPQVQRRRAQKSGDTNSKKEFSGGYIHIGSANNHKDIRDVSLRLGLFDDWESVKGKSKESGNTRKLLEQRFAAYADSHKIAYVSTPELEENSNIEAAYLLGDQRKYMIPCPCCSAYIELKWHITNGEITGGITWKVDDNGKVISESVGYICQECGDFFDDKNKHELLNAGHWKPTAEPSKPGYYSYHISSLYAPIGMYNWEHYVNDYIEANPEGQPRNEDLWKTFVNVVLGETYKNPATELKANLLQKNTRTYEINTIPEKMSIADGNGRIVLLTFACDLNGPKDDARLDWEIVGWSENNTSYSISHGSIGTFIPNESNKKNKVVREAWTYEHHRPNSVWPELNKILATEFKTDTGRKMKILISAMDTGWCEHEAFTYIDNSNFYILGIKGDKEEKYVNRHIEQAVFKQGISRQNLYMLRVGRLKDRLAAMMKLFWDSGNDDQQPAGFMNFPNPSDGKYTYNNYFSHFEAEIRKIDKDGNFIWEKKNAIVQNHLFDCRIYNIAIKEILTDKVCKEMKIPNYTWNDMVKVLTGGK